jgi:hypothetical protein
MRCDQYVGLNPWASKLVSRKIKVHEVGVRTFPNGRSKRFNRWYRMPLARITKIGKIKGAWNDHVADLHRYTFPDGRVFVEYVQASPWSGGPCYFIALKDRHGRPVPESLWTDDELMTA